MGGGIPGRVIERAGFYWPPPSPKEHLRQKANCLKCFRISILDARISKPSLNRCNLNGLFVEVLPLRTASIPDARISTLLGTT